MNRERQGELMLVVFSFLESWFPIVSAFAVELIGAHTRGMTVCDYRHIGKTGTDIAGEEGARRGPSPNAQVAYRLDTPRFFDLLINALSNYS